MNCTSCKRAIENDPAATSFGCPLCSSRIARCGACRKNSVSYKCDCSFEGP